MTKIEHLRAEESMMCEMCSGRAMQDFVNRHMVLSPAALFQERELSKTCPVRPEVTYVEPVWKGVV